MRAAAQLVHFRDCRRAAFLSFSTAMIPAARHFFRFFTTLVFLTISAPTTPAEVIDGWTVVTRDDDLTTFSRPRKDSSLLEYKAVGVLEAAPIVIKRVIDDTAEYPNFMPYVIETKTIANNGTTRIGYQRLSPPFVGDRDYTVRVKCESKRCPVTGGTIYCNRWDAANDLGPAEKKGVARVKVTEGAWLLEPTADGKTRATYTIYSDSGGGIPAMILNKANKTAIPKLFDAVRKQAKLEKYQRKEP
jgi:ribosome-associated toxin RatA of RatAB toxin-antitoxin module